MPSLPLVIFRLSAGMIWLRVYGEPVNCLPAPRVKIRSKMGGGRESRRMRSIRKGGEGGGLTGVAMAQDVSFLFKRDIPFDLAAVAFSVSRHGVWTGM